MDNDKHDLLEQLFHLAGLLRRRTMQMHGERGPLSSRHQGQGRVLALLKLKPEVSQKELSTILDIRSQSLGELLAKLERQGYVTRTPSEEDRRGMNISLTEAGKIESEKQDEKADFDSFFDCLETEEQKKLGESLERLSRRLEEEIAAAGGEGDVPSAFGAWHRGFGRPGGFPGFDRGHGGDRRPHFGGRGFGRPTAEDE
ncbi:MAG: MarR family winged helix-turn-helix transcriptional regulator [Rectinemataceae bacterium]